MVQIRPQFFLIILIANLLQSALAQTSGSSVPPADLDTYVASSMKAFEVPGLAVAIV